MTSRPPLHLLPLKSLIEYCFPYRVTTVVGIDGIGGSGKSTFAAALQRIDPTIVIVHTDDFYRGLNPATPPEDPTEVGVQIDWRRLVEQLLVPLNRDDPGRYQRFDWDTQSLAEWHDVPANVLVLIEGVYAIRDDLTPYLDASIWVETPAEISTERGIARDGEASRDWWLDHWLADERRYAAGEGMPGMVTFVVDGTNGQEAYAQGLYARVRSLE